MAAEKEKGGKREKKSVRVRALLHSVRNSSTVRAFFDRVGHQNLGHQKYLCGSSEVPGSSCVYMGELQ